MSIEARIARFVREAEPDDDTLDIMRLALFDWAVCAIAGRDEPVARILRDHAVAEAAHGSAVVVGGDPVPPSRAALINGATSHALDYDDTHFAHIGHTSVAVVPAALAVAQGADLQDVISAALIGSEVAVRVGLWLGRGHYQVGFHQTATAGAFGAAMAASRLMRLTEAQMVTALGLAATKAAGLKSQFGTMGKPLNAGLAAETGVLAAGWAAAGMSSCQAGLSGPLGFGATHHGAADDTAFDDMTTRWLMRDVSHKFHACCHGLHAMLEALAGASGPVQSAEVFTHPRWMSVCDNPAPKTGLEAKFSYRLTAAMALSGVSTARIESFSNDVTRAPALVALRDRVTVQEDPTLTEMQALVKLTMTDGAVQTLFHDLDAPLTTSARADRLMQKARAVVGRALAENLWQAVASGDLARVTGLLQRPNC